MYVQWNDRVSDISRDIAIFICRPKIILTDNSRIFCVEFVDHFLGWRLWCCNIDAILISSAYIPTFLHTFCGGLHCCENNVVIVASATHGRDIPECLFMIFLNEKDFCYWIDLNQMSVWSNIYNCRIGINSKYRPC